VNCPLLREVPTATLVRAAAHRASGESRRSGQVGCLCFRFVNRRGHSSPAGEATALGQVRGCASATSDHPSAAQQDKDIPAPWSCGSSDPASPNHAKCLAFVTFGVVTEGENRPSASRRNRQFGAHRAGTPVRRIEAVVNVDVSNAQSALAFSLSVDATASPRLASRRAPALSPVSRSMKTRPG